MPDDYVHRIGRTARHKAEGDAFVLVSPAEEKSLAQIERQIGQRLPRVTLPDFDYKQVVADNGPRHQGHGHGHRSPRPHESRPRQGRPHPGASRNGTALIRLSANSADRRLSLRERTFFRGAKDDDRLLGIARALPPRHRHDSALSERRGDCRRFAVRFRFNLVGAASGFGE